ncbi:MAG: DNA methyltransferase [Thermodesulfobacteriota bacterium]|nr:DNA methyltransferase [Thermodesulfobacteriota bacterium]
MGKLPEGQGQLPLINDVDDGSEGEKGPVECLGMTFENDEARREYFLDKLREKLKDPEFRKIEGFPIGEDEDILALSDPPYYTACPNPWIGEFVKIYGKKYDPNEPYHREPFAADVSEGKNDPVYNAHTYHTKVPPKAILKYILHYTEPGDLVFDGFCGTGMTGIAAQLCGNSILGSGIRKSILCDLSTIATFISGTLNKGIDQSIRLKNMINIIERLEQQLSWLYETKHKEKTIGKINYIVWSEVFICSNCSSEIVFYEASNHKDKDSNDFLTCKSCYATHEKRKLERAYETIIDYFSNNPIKQTKQVPVLINYSIGGKRFEKQPDNFDLTLIKKINDTNLHQWFPSNEIPKIERYYKDGLHLINITHTHQFYTKRNLLCASTLYEKLKFNVQKLIFTSFCERHIVKRNRWLPTGPTRPLNNTLYFPPLYVEVNVFEIAKRKLKDYLKAYEIVKNFKDSIVTCQSSTAIPSIPDSSIDYIFTDPPFGWNLIYSELSFLWESWLKLITNNKNEAIVNLQAHKTLDDYRKLMARCFSENFRVLKPGRWMTVEFHNSSNIVWQSIQEALMIAGFVIADVRTLDKKQGSINQDYYRAGAVKQDLVISVYKPNSGVEERFKLEAGTEEGVWDFIRTHLKQLPVFVLKGERAEIIAERQNYLLFDRMIAFHVQRGVMVPISAGDFYAGLAQRFPERDGMYFLPEQVAEYDKKRMSVKEVLQLELFVLDEASAIQWLKQQLTKRPQTFQELHPQFIKEIGGWQKHEKPLELSEMLEQNFLRYDGKGEVPSQIHSYLSTNFKDLRNLSKSDPSLLARAKDRWYVPDPNKAGDLEKLRERSLLKEFAEYRESKQSRLKVFRLEAVRAGFKKAWQDKDYTTIIEVAKKIPENVLQEDPKLLMWYDQALTRTGMEE